MFVKAGEDAFTLAFDVTEKTTSNISCFSDGSKIAQAILEP